MLSARLLIVSSHFKRNSNFFPKTKILLTCKDLVIVNKVFLCSINENPNTIKALEKKLIFREVYYQQYLLNSSKYKNLIFHGGIQTNSKTIAVLNQLHQERVNNSNLKDELSDHLDRELNQFSFSELCEVVFLVTKFVSQNDSDPIWEKIFESINTECLVRMPYWTPDELVKMIYISMVLRQPLKFKQKLMFKLAHKSSTSQQIVFLFYFILKKKFSIAKKDLLGLQKKIVKIFPEINSTEAGIIAEGINCSFKNLQNKDVFYGILKKGYDVDIIDKIPFFSFCKFARLMSNKSNFEEIKEFQKNSIKTALRLGVEEIIVLALTGEKVRYLDPNLQTVLMEEVKNRIRQISTFHIQRVAYIATLFNIHDEEFLKQAVDVFEAKAITENNRKNCLLFLSHLTNFKLYPKNLINIVFEEEFVKKLIGYGKNYVCALWLIYCGLNLEDPEYLTFDIAPEIRNKIYKQSRVKFFTCPNYHSKLWKVEAILIKLYGEGTVKYLMPLPLYPIGIVMKFDKNLNPQKLHEELETLNKTFEMKPLKDDHIWLFIILADHSVKTDISSNVPTLAFQTQVRQLNALGYTTLPVYKNFHFKEISVEDQEVSDYFKSLINTKLEECYKDQKGVIIC